ncbi:hypothetical protein EJ05DRAFT_161576 [Pseudovirgaria hyperparasitica]|uniref:Uncharacterized protein n=1 Tax=Pseudovirgaria hyperparasitica TaxID=470096 RepID=A0A6A6VWG2_9PEZI|nr:uncharacterized protein EJ05DRAFT_161576 [Pseudovirgaria hyperparasitica]KAF2753980.1 hypothetical protein EJ05DRAFT_161576 [Pseudovirgaria hyperparasitica]
MPPQTPHRTPDRTTAAPQSFPRLNPEYSGDACMHPPIPSMTHQSQPSHLTPTNIHIHNPTKDPIYLINPIYSTHQHAHAPNSPTNFTFIIIIHSPRVAPGPPSLNPRRRNLIGANTRNSSTHIPASRTIGPVRK